MRLDRYDTIMKEKFAKRDQITNLEYHIGGQCIHIGKISAGCRQCFTGEPNGGGIQVGQECMCNCPMCYYDPKRSDEREPQTQIDNKLADMYYNIQQPNYNPISMSYQSTGETLIYIDQLAKFAAMLIQNNKTKGIHTYHHLYTNGLLADEKNLNLMKNMNVHEIRFHLSASNWSKTVINNMYEAAKMGFIVSVEEPSWPDHRDKLFEMLPVFQDIGVQHLNLVEVQLTNFNFDKVDKTYPNGRYYKDLFYHFYDEGLVYNIMQEVIDKEYSYSVLDCNSGVERFRHGKNEYVRGGLPMSELEGMCAPHDYFSPMPEK